MMTITRSCIACALLLASCGGKDKPDELRARCERFVTKVMQLGTTEADSSHAEKVELCVQEKPPASLFDCVERANTAEQVNACE
jgi:hypothetical protein